MNPYDTLPALPFGNPDEEEETEQVVTEGAGAMRAYQEMLYGVSAFDPATWIAAVAVLTAVALLAAFLPALRAASVDPMQALRTE